MDYDAIDRAMSRAFVGTTLNGTDMFLTAEGLYSDDHKRARIFNRIADAWVAADAENASPSWQSPERWRAYSVAALLSPLAETHPTGHPEQPCAYTIVEEIIED